MGTNWKLNCRCERIGSSISTKRTGRLILNYDFDIRTCISRRIFHSTISIRLLHHASWNEFTIRCWKKWDTINSFWIDQCISHDNFTLVNLSHHTDQSISWEWIKDAKYLKRIYNKIKVYISTKLNEKVNNRPVTWTEYLSTFTLTPWVSITENARLLTAAYSCVFERDILCIKSTTFIVNGESVE